MGTAIDPSEINRFEVTEVYNHPDAKVDIVLVHGLNGDPRMSWTAPKNGTFWPSQLLPATLKNIHARVLVYGYNADVYAFGSGKSAGSDMIYQHAQTLIQNLAMDRKVEHVQNHPIIFVCHSLGGILVKRALELSNDITSPHANDNRNIYVSTYGILFLGTPHTGSDTAKWGIMLENMVHTLIPKKFMQTHSQLVKTLKSNNETLQNINVHFLDITQRFRITAAHEEMETDLYGTKSLIVDQLSASPQLPGWDYFGIASDHSGMCKYESKNSPGWKVVSGTLMTWIQDAPATIKPRQEMEARQRKLKLDFDAAELTGKYTQGNTPAGSIPPSMNNSTVMVPKATIDIAPSSEEEERTKPYFVKPSGFRPNSYFVGRQAELAELHKMLFDQKKRSTGTSAVLIQSLPGGGKTHLAREYVYEYKDKFPGGIFWLRAKSETELAAGYWDIACKAALKQQHTTSLDLNTHEEFIKIVRKWLNKRHDWLMVLDGISFTPNLQKFIPDSTDTSLIYTSTERSATGYYLWMSPQTITLQRLKALDAQHLLLQELDKKEPYSKEDLQNSMELVQLMEYLPLVIHTIARRLKLTDEHLGKFARSYASEPRLRGLGAYIAVVDQLKVLGAYEALNLMYILCFFSQHIPVEMINLGLSVLDNHKPRIPIRASEPVTGNTMNNTFSMLITFALIERNLQEMDVQASQSSRRSRDMLADNIDVIRLHSVVQGFFVDTLLDGEDKKSAPKYSEWLRMAVDVFCCSYDNANDRITRQVNAALVEDYRLYEIHGIRLREHLTRHKKIPMPVVLDQLDLRLANIKKEIEQRTPGTSEYIAAGRTDILPVSIFDKSSSSSDTGPNTPSDEHHRRLSSKVSTWGMEPHQEKHESPRSIRHHDSEFREPPLSIPIGQFPPLLHQDPGYESDRESSNAMTAQPSRQTVTQNKHSPISPLVSPGGAWEVVQPGRRIKSKPPTLDIGNHRTTKLLEKTRYRDTAGAFRAINDPRSRAHTIDPRLSHELAKGSMVNAQSRNSSRGRLSSEAQEALANISKNSPPPARGGGMIMDRGSSSQRGNEKRMSVGATSYAQAVAGSTDAVSGFREPIRPTSEPVENSNTSASTLENWPQSAAKEALQRFPIAVVPPSPRLPQSPQSPYISMPPYPQTPAIEYDEPFDFGLVQPQPTRTYQDENLSLGPDPYPSNIYPRMPGTVPFETQQSRSSSSPLRYNFEQYDEHTFATAGIQEHPQREFISISSPNIRSPPIGFSRGSTYIPGHPELSHDGGYTSQPMSRDPSGQSTPGAGEKRRPSLTVTEPAPQLPMLSPPIPPTSYQIKARLQDEAVQRGERRDSVRKMVDLEDWGHLSETVPLQPKRKFNPTARAFNPNQMSTTNESPTLPSAPPNSAWSGYTNPSNLPSNNSSRYTSPLPPHVPFAAPRTSPSSHNSPFAPPQRSSPSSHNSPLPVPYPTPNSPRSFAEGGGGGGAGYGGNRGGGIGQGGENMGRTPSGGSGGMVVGGQMIEFGEISVRVQEARDRAELGRRRIEREENGRVEGLGISGAER